MYRHNTEQKKKVIYLIVNQYNNQKMSIHEWQHIINLGFGKCMKCTRKSLTTILNIMSKEKEIILEKEKYREAVYYKISVPLVAVATV